MTNRKKRTVRVAVIPVAGPVEYLDVPREEFTLEWLQRKVDGYVEDFRGLDPRYPPAIMYVNDQGRLRRLEINVRATSLLRSFCPMMGTAVLAGPTDGHADSHEDLPKEWEDALREIEDKVYGRGSRVPRGRG